MNIELPQIKHRKSGLVKQGRIYSIIYYVDGKQRKSSSGETALPHAIKARDKLYAELIRDNGATVLGSKISKAVQAAINEPTGMACIYTATTYRVRVNGVHIITTTDKQKAIDARNEYITNNITHQVI